MYAWMLSGTVSMIMLRELCSAQPMVLVWQWMAAIAEAARSGEGCAAEEGAFGVPQ